MAELTLFADYYQIHAFDEGSQADLGGDWTDQAMADHLAVDGTEFDHVVEASISCSSGQLVVMGCTDYEPDAPRFPAATGWLRLRVSQSNLDRAYRAGIDSDDDPHTMERLRLQAWPAVQAPVVVVKRWRSPA